MLLPSHIIRTIADQEKNKECLLIPFGGATFSRVERLVSKYNLYSVFHPLVKLTQLLCPMKDITLMSYERKTLMSHVSLGLHVPDISSIPCTCGRVYIGQTGCTVLERYGEHSRNIRLKQQEVRAC